MPQNESYIELYKRLDGLHFIRYEEKLLLLIELCLYTYLSDDETRLKFAKDYQVDDRYCAKGLLREAEINPYNAASLYFEAREHFAHAGKSNRASEILQLIFGNVQSIAIFKGVSVKNTRYVNAILGILAAIKDPQALSEEILGYAIRQMGRSERVETSPGIAKIITKFISSGKDNLSFYDPAGVDYYLSDTIWRTCKPKSVSYISRADFDIIMTTSLALLNGLSFDAISFRIGDLLADADSYDKKYDLITANIPANVKLSQSDLIAYSRSEQFTDCFRLARPTLETLILKKVINRLNDGGRAFLIVAGDILSSQKPSNKQFRTMLVDSGLLRGILKIPSGALLCSAIESYIIFLEKEASPEVFFADSSTYFIQDRPGASITDENAAKLFDDIQNNRHIQTANIDDIRDDDYRLNVSYYTDSPKLRQIFSEGNCKKLSELATILIPEPNVDCTSSKVVDLKKLTEYPFNPRTMCADGPETFALHQNDIIVHGSVQSPKVYILQDQANGINAPKGCVVLRPTSIQPEYLAVYLSSDAAKTALELVQKITKGGKSFFKSIYIDSDLLTELPVPAPSKKPEEYEKRFRVENKYHIKYEDLLFYLSENDSRENGDSPTIDSLLDEELLRNAPRYKQEVFEASMNRDIDELKICYDNGAYKAATILAGSILEAILIDWLSELWKTNYFETDFPTSDGHKANLIDYINSIEFIKRPEWLKEAEEAHHIRQMRNSVHAKVSIGKEITRSECDKVIRYLQDVLVSRKANS